MKHPFSENTITEDGRLMLRKMEKDQVETVWERFSAQQPQCGFCEMGLSCRVCNMAPLHMAQGSSVTYKLQPSSR